MGLKPSPLGCLACNDEISLVNTKIRDRTNGKPLYTTQENGKGIHILT